MHFSTFLCSALAMHLYADTFAVPTGIHDASAVEMGTATRDLHVRANEISGVTFHIGNYIVKAGTELGRGAFAIVYSAEIHPSRNGMKGALKYHKGDPDIIPGAELIRKYVRDFSNIIQPLATLRRPRTDGQLLLMERGQGTVEDMIRTGMYRDEERIRRHMIGILRGFEALHRVGLSHSDGHSENYVFVGRSPKLTDFDLVRDGQWQRNICGRMDILGPGKFPSLLRDGGWLITYVEAMMGLGHIDAYANDVWAAGVLVIRMITGTNPWQTARDPLPQRLWGERKSAERQRILKAHIPALSTNLCRILSWVFTTQQNRYTAFELSDDLQHLDRFVSSQPRMLSLRADGDGSKLDTAANYLCGFGGHNNTASSFWLTLKR
jgi:serine/threonine protein kinase